MDEKPKDTPEAGNEGLSVLEQVIEKATAKQAVEQDIKGNLDLKPQRQTKLISGDFRSFRGRQRP